MSGATFTPIEDEDAERPEPPKVIDHTSTTTAERDRDRSKLS